MLVRMEWNSMCPSCFHRPQKSSFSHPWGNVVFNVFIMLSILEFLRKQQGKKESRNSPSSMNRGEFSLRMLNIPVRSGFSLEFTPLCGFFLPCAGWILGWQCLWNETRLHLQKKTFVRRIRGRWGYLPRLPESKCKIKAAKVCCIFFSHDGEQHRDQLFWLSLVEPEKTVNFRCTDTPYADEEFFPFI